jgi:hypothetical protein
MKLVQDDTVQIVRYSRKHYDGSTIHEYEARCLRCHRDVVSNAGRIGVPHNRAWATKPPAVRAAREHLEWHQQTDKCYEENPVQYAHHGWRLVEEVTL